MTICNTIGVVSSDKTIKNYHPTLHFPSDLRSFFCIFHLIVLFLLFWFTLTALISLLTRHSGQLFSAKKLKDRLYATCPAPNGRQSKLATICVRCIRKQLKTLVCNPGESLLIFELNSQTNALEHQTFFSIHTERTASRLWGDICWIWQKYIWLELQTL